MAFVEFATKTQEDRARLHVAPGVLESREVRVASDPLDVEGDIVEVLGVDHPGCVRTQPDLVQRRDRRVRQLCGIRGEERRRGDSPGQLRQAGRGHRGGAEGSRNSCRQMTEPPRGNH